MADIEKLLRMKNDLIKRKTERNEFIQWQKNLLEILKPNSNEIEEGPFDYLFCMIEEMEKEVEREIEKELTKLNRQLERGEVENG